jgi:hypothetical protein
VAERAQAAKASRAKNPVLRAALQSTLSEEEVERDWPVAAMGVANLVNYGNAPAGGQVYDSNWLATNTTAR